MQQKYLSIDNCEIKFAGPELKAGEFEGYASTFGNEDSYGDVVVKGAFEKSLDRKIPMLHSHDPSKIIGIWKSVHEDASGLKVKGEFTPGNSLADDTYASLKHGALSGMSIGFRIPKGGSDWNEEKNQRLIKEADLVEISLVSMPANVEAQITTVKSFEFNSAIEAIESLRDAERILRDAGFSKSAALAFVSRVHKIQIKRDADSELADELKRILGTAAKPEDLKRLLK